MRIQSGTQASPITLRSIHDDKLYDTTQLTGRRYMVSFFRFATCPFCNMRVRSLITNKEAFHPSFEIVGIFDSPFEHLKKHASGHNAWFPVLADETRAFYDAWGVENSVGGMLKGMVTRMPTLFKGMAKGHVPLQLKGSMTSMPAEFLVNEEGTIETAFYGKDDGDHMPIDIIAAFSHQAS